MMPAGSPPPAPSEFVDAGMVCAIDGDGTSLCSGGAMEQIDHHSWDEVPARQRCTVCGILAGAA